MTLEMSKAAWIHLNGAANLFKLVNFVIQRQI